MFLTDVLKVPEGVHTPCATHREVFVTQALDPCPDEWTLLSPEEQHRVAIEKRDAEMAAVRLCLACPILDECREWSQKADVFGVVGGLKNGERYGYDLIDRYIANGATPENEELIAVWLSKGKPLDWIALRLDVSLMDVATVRDRLAGAADSATINKGPNEQASKAVHLKSRVSPVTSALFDILANTTKPLEKDDIVKELVSIVPSDDARRRAPTKRKFNSDADKVRIGATRYVRNIIRIAVRDENIFEMDHPDGGLQLIMDPSLAADWRNLSEDREIDITRD